MKRTTIAVIAVVLLAGLAGCVGGEDPNNSGEERNGTVIDGEVTRFVDTEAGVVCYKYEDDSWEQGGISCVPLEQTDLDGGEL